MFVQRRAAGPETPAPRPGGSPRRDPGAAALLLALLGAAGLMAVIGATTDVFWETNDDPAMMMYAHGIGLGGAPSPLLLFSNLWQGHLVLALGWPFGLAGYSLYLLAAQVLATGLAAWLLGRMTGAPWISFLVVAALSLRPMMAPQFTLTAGFLCAAGVLAWLAHAHAPRRFLPPLGALLCLAGFLMREQMALLFALLALPLLLRAPLLRSRGLWLWGGVLLLAALGARLDHARALAAPEWRAFQALNLPRAAFTDFELMPRVAASPQALAAAGWSQNDLAMVRLFWFVDQELASPAALTAAIEAVGGVGSLFRLDPARLGPLGVEFLRWDFLGAGLIALFGLVFARGAERWRLLACALLALSALLFLATAGRLSLGRVGYPALALLAMAATAALRPAMLRPAGGVALAAALLVALELVPRAAATNRQLPAAQTFLNGLERGRIHVLWGASLPIEALYAPLRRRRDMPDITFYGLGTHQLSPSALARWDGDVSRVVARLRGPEGLDMVLFDAFLPMLRTYCAERLRGTLRFERHSELRFGPTAWAGTILAGRARCAAD